MTFPFRRRPLDLDEEGKRATEALRRVMDVRKDSPDSAEWRQWEGRRRRRRARRTFGVIAMVVAVVAVGVGGWFGGRFAFAWVKNDTGWLRIRTVEVSGLGRLSESEVLAAAGIGVGEYWFDADPDSAAARLLAVPLVKSATVTRTWKRAVAIAITERKPVALALVDRPVEIDEDAVVLPPDPSGFMADLPIVRGLEGIVAEPGRPLADPAAMPAARLSARLAGPNVNLADRVSEIWAAEPDSLVLVLMRDAVPVKVGRGDIPERRLVAFGAVLADLEAKDIEPEYLDLRFARQVVVKPQPEDDEKTEPAPAPPTIAKPVPPKTRGAKPAITKPAPKKSSAALKKTPVADKKSSMKKPVKKPTARTGNKGRRSRHGRNT
jgi:cell division septal protein FtsQ